MVDQDFAQFFSIPPFDLGPTVEVSLVGEHLKLLFYTDYLSGKGAFWVWDCIIGWSNGKF